MSVLRAAAAFVLVLVLVSSATTGAPAAPPVPPAPPGSSAPPGAPAAGPGAEWTVTLLTGDRVRVARDGSGEYRATAVDAATQDLQVTAEGDHLYVVPGSVAPLVPAVLDPALFDVRLLVGEGLDDARSADIPLLVDQAGTADAGRLESSGALDAGRVLRRAGIVTATVGKSRAGRLGSQLAERAGRGRQVPGPTGGTGTTSTTGTTGPAAAQATGAGVAGIRRIWLDRKVHVAWDENLEQIGAPQAWESGADGAGVKLAVLDTGADATHPDLAGRVAAATDYTGKGSIADGHGHGTHVAATAAGSGAGNAGQRKGVAPAAELLVGKVLADSGSGQTGWVLAGMEWAVAQGADVVSMSLSGTPTDGSDPLSTALDRLTATGTLFVVAAGNEGPGAATVGSPGSADGALTVAAVDGADAVADFSSRGPRARDGALKPDLAGPGVGIVAARATGTSMGTPVDASYTAASGTSMATPHVAGAAALLLQRRPGLSPAEVKAVLAGTAHGGTDGGADAGPAAQGAGRIDLVRALGTTVRPDDEDADLGLLRFPQTGPATTTAGWHNDGDQPVTLDLELAMTGPDGAAEPAGLATLSADAVTVPAGGHAEVTIAVDPTRTAPGVHSGYLTATVAGSGAQLRTPVGFLDEDEMYDLTVRGVERDGAPAAWEQFQLYDIEEISRTGGNAFRYFDQSGTAVLRLPKGHYLLSARLIDYGADDTRHGSALTIVPEVDLSGDTTTVLDARAAEPVADVVAGVSAATMSTEVLYRRTDGVGKDLVFWTAETMEQPFSLPRASVPLTVGKFVTSLSSHLTDRLVRLRTTGADPAEVRVSPLDRTVLPAPGRYPTVDLGTGTAAEFAAAGDLTGRLAVVRRGEAVADLRARATAAHAVALAMLNDRPGVFGPTYSQQGPLPILAVDGDDADRLSGPVDVVTTPYSAYTYDLNRTASGDFPRPLARTYSAAEQRELARVEAHYPSGPGNAVAVRPNFGHVAGLAPVVVGRDVRTEYVTPGAKLTSTAWWEYPRPQHKFRISDHGRVYRQGERATVNWFAAPMHSTIGGQFDPPIARSGNSLSASVTALTDGDGHGGILDSGNSGPTTVNTFRLYRDGALTAERTGFVASLPLAADPARYRLESSADSGTTTPLRTRTENAWEFTSARSADGRAAVLPLPRIDYDLRLGGDTALSRLTTLIGRRVTVRVLPQPDIVGNPAPPVRAREVTVSYSTDDGASWHRAVPAGPQGRNVATVELPRLPRGAVVSLRTEVTTTDGVRLDQRIVRAAVAG